MDHIGWRFVFENRENDSGGGGASGGSSVVIHMDGVMILAKFTFFVQPMFSLCCDLSSTPLPLEPWKLYVICRCVGDR